MLVPPEKSHDADLAALRSRVAEREAALSERDAEVGRVKLELEQFRLNYRQQVGVLHEQLDALEAAIAEAEADVRPTPKPVENADAGARESPTGVRPAPLPRFTSDAVRRLFRDVAKAIHPDLTSDELTRDRRHTLMVEANRAYASRDEEQLRLILQVWENSPEAVLGTDPEAMRLRLIRRAMQIEDQLGVLASELAEMKDTPLWTLKAMVDDASKKGKDLVRDMTARLKRDITVATNRLDAMRPPA